MIDLNAIRWAVGLDWLFWQTLPQFHTLIGGAVIIASGIVLIRRERPATVIPA